MALPATDTFTGTNGTALQTYSANWTINAGGIQIFNNQATGSVDFVEQAAHWNADTFQDDQYSQAAMSGNTLIAMGVAVRCALNGSANYYSWYGNPGSGQLAKVVAGTWTQLGSTSGTITSGSVMRLEAEGTTLRPYDDGVIKNPPGQQTDSAHSSGAAGLAGFDDEATLANMTLVDNWEGGNLFNVAAYEQEGYRFRLDDGNETGATWDGAQDAAIAAPAQERRRLRILSDTATNNPDSTQVKLQYRKVGDADSEWRDVL